MNSPDSSRDCSREAHVLKVQGDAHARKNNFDKAIQQYWKAIDLDPTSIAVWNNLGYSYAKSGNFDQAIQYYLKAIDLDPTSIAVWNNLGYSYAKSGKDEDAERCREKIRQLKARAADRTNTGPPRRSPSGLPPTLPVNPEREPVSPAEDAGVSAGSLLARLGLRSTRKPAHREKRGRNRTTIRTRWKPLVASCSGRSGKLPLQEYRSRESRDRNHLNQVNPEASGKGSYIAPKTKVNQPILQNQNLPSMNRPAAPGPPNPPPNVPVSSPG